MLLTWILGGAAVGFASAFVYAYSKMKDLEKKYDDCTCKLFNQCSETERLYNENVWLDGDLSRAKLEVESYKSIAPNGYPETFDYSMVRSEYRVCVYAIHPNCNGGTVTVPIKAIPIENGDEEFAIREAEELIETIKNF